MQPPENARRWQLRLDREFPQGIILSAANLPPSQNAFFPVPRPEVIGMRGLDPVVFFDIPSQGRNMSAVITAWTEIQAEPCRVVQATLHTGGEPASREVLLSGNVSDSLAAKMAPRRSQSLALSAAGEVYRGSPQ